MINIKSDREISIMREAGKILAGMHNEVGQKIKAGMTTYEVDEIAYKYLVKHNATPSFYKLYDFPMHVCVSINDEVIHGIPSRNRIIKDGDIVKVDAGACYEGYHSDATRIHMIGNVSSKVKNLVLRTQESFFEALKKCIVGNHIGDIAKSIDNYVSNYGYVPVVDYTGHGIGNKVHEDPDVPNYEMTNRGALLRKNMTLAIEPMINMESEDVFVEKDNWTVKTCDGLCSAHYENTVLITDGEPEILSL